ncbi:hypothetical protein ACTA71_000336 [Dictyostelium dimigraforme]
MNTNKYYGKKNIILLFLNFLEASSFSSLFIVFYFSENQYATLSIMLFLGSLFLFTRLLVIAFHFHIVWPLLEKSHQLEYNNISDIKEKLNELNHDSNKVIIYFNGKDSNFEKYANIRLKNLICNQTIISPSFDQLFNNNEFEKKMNYININFKYNYSTNLIPNILEEFIKKYPNQLLWPNRELFEIEKIGFNNNYLLCCTKKSNYTFKSRKIFSILSILFGVSWFYYYFSFYRNLNFNEIIIEKSIDTTYQQLLNDMKYNKILYDIGKQLIFVHNEQFKIIQQQQQQQIQQIPPQKLQEKQKTPQDDDVIEIDQYSNKIQNKKQEEKIIELINSPNSIVETVLEINQKNDTVIDIVIGDDNNNNSEHVNYNQKILFDLPLIAIESNTPICL